MGFGRRGVFAGAFWAFWGIAATWPGLLVAGLSRRLGRSAKVGPGRIRVGGIRVGGIRADGIRAAGIRAAG